MTTTPPTKKPIQKIPEKDIKIKWSDVFEVRVEPSLDGKTEKLGDHVKEALTRLQANKFIGNENSLDGQKMMQEAAAYLEMEKAAKMKDPHLNAQEKAKVPNVKFIIKVHDQPYDPKKGLAIQTYVSPNGTHLLGAAIGLNELRKLSDYDGKQTKLPPELADSLKLTKVEMLVAGQIGQLAHGVVNKEVAQHYKTIVSEARRKETLIKMEEASRKTAPSAPHKNQKPKQSGKEIGMLVDPDQFPNLSLVTNPDIITQSFIMQVNQPLTRTKS